MSETFSKNIVKTIAKNFCLLYNRIKLKMEVRKVTDEKGQAYTEMLQLFNLLQQWNDFYTSENANNLLVACQQLLINYNEPVLKFINDENEDKSLLQYLAGDDGLAQWQFYKGFYNNYNVHIF